MNPRHNEIAPLYTSSVNSTRFPPPSNSNGGVRRGRGRPRGPRASSPRILSHPQLPTSLRPPRILSHPQLPTSLRPPTGLRPMYQPVYQSFPYGSQPPMSRPAPSWLPYYPPAPVTNYTDELARLVFMNAQRMGNGGSVYGMSSPMMPQRMGNGGNLYGMSSPMMPQRMGNGGNLYGMSSPMMPQIMGNGGNVYGMSSPMMPQRMGNGGNVYGMSSPMMPQSSAGRMIYQRPMQMPVGVMPNGGPGGNESRGGAVLLTDYMDPDKIFYVYNENDLEIIFPGDSEYVNSSGGSENSYNLNGHESPYLPGGNENALSDPRHAKRILANPEPSAHSNAKRVRRVQEREADVSTGNSQLNERSLSVLEDENKELGIGANVLQELLPRPNALTEQLTVEDHQLDLESDLESGELMFDISEYLSDLEPLDLDIFQTYNPSLLDEQPQTNLDFNEHII